LGQQFHEVDHSLFIAWKNQEVDLVRHQAVSNDGCMVLLSQFPGPLEIIKPIIFPLEYVPAVVSPLYGMMAYIGYNKASIPCHA